MEYGYARVSSTDQDLSIQQAALSKAGCKVIRAEKKSGGSTAGRHELENLLEFIRAGDVLVVTRLDRLARNLEDLLAIVRRLKEKNAALRVLDHHIDTGTASGRAFMAMLGVFAEFERDLRRERQLEGIAKAKAAGVYKGRQPSIDPAEVRRLKKDGLGPSQIARQLKIGRASVYRLLALVPGRKPTGR